MDSPMPGIVLMVLAAALVYQLGFRYEHWTGGPQNSIVYERDSLLGNVREVRPGEHFSFIDRLLGSPSQGASRSNESPQLAKASTSEEPNATQQLSRWGQQLGQQVGERVKSFSDGPPVPVTANAPEDKKLALRLSKQSENAEGFALAGIAEDAPTIEPTRIDGPIPTSANSPIVQAQVKETILQNRADLNHDASAENVVISKASAQDGLRDISVVGANGQELFYGRGKALTVLQQAHEGWQDLALQISTREQIVYRFNPQLGGYSLFGTRGGV
jgi:hypothetical protein